MSQLFLNTYNLNAQVVPIAFQGFEGAANDTWTYTPPFQNAAIPQLIVGAGNYGPGYSLSGINSLRFGGGSASCGVGSANCINGTSAGGSCIDNQNGSVINFAPVSVSCYENVQLSVAYRTHVLCTSPTFQGQGLDSGDRLDFDVSLNGGAFVNQASIAGFNNCTWTYATATIQCNGGFAVVSNPFVFNVPPGVETVALRLRLVINRSDEVMYLDDVSLTGELKNVAFSYPEPVCESDLSVSPIVDPLFDTDGVFSAIPSSLAFDVNTGEIFPSISLPTSYEIVYSIGGAVCSTTNISIFPSPITTPIYHD